MNTEGQRQRKSRPGNECDSSEHADVKCVTMEECSPWVAMLESGTSPLCDICGSYGDERVVFDVSFVEKVVEFAKRGGDGAFDLIARLIPENASDLSMCGVFDVLLAMEPDTIDLIQEVLEGCDERGVYYFANGGGLYLLAKYSQCGELKLAMSRMLRAALQVELEYTMLAFPNLTAGQLLGEEDVGDIVEFSPVEIFKNLTEDADLEVMGNLLEGLRSAFRWTPAVVAFSPWLLQSLEALLGGELAPLSIEVLAKGLKSIPSFFLKKWSVEDLAVRFVQSPIEPLQIVGMKLVQVLLNELAPSFDSNAQELLQKLLSPDFKLPLVALSQEGSFLVKELALKTLHVMMRNHPLSSFRAFVEPEIMEMVLAMFDSDYANSDGVMLAEKGIALALMDIMGTLLEKYTFAAVDEQTRANMHHICCSLRSVVGAMDPEIAGRAESLILSMAGFWEDPDA